MDQYASSQCVYEVRKPINRGFSGGGAYNCGNAPCRLIFVTSPQKFNILRDLQDYLGVLVFLQRSMQVPWVKRPSRAYVSCLKLNHSAALA